MQSGIAWLASVGLNFPSCKKNLGVNISPAHRKELLAMPSDHSSQAIPGRGPFGTTPAMPVVPLFHAVEKL